MGTSTNYEAGPNWGPIKTQVSRTAARSFITPSRASRVLRPFVRQLQSNDGAGGAGGGGGGSAMSGGRSGGGGTRGRSSSGTRAARSVAHSLGGFLADAGQRGIRESLKEQGLGDLIGKTVKEVMRGLVSVLGGPSSTLDEVDARNALDETLHELTRDSKSFEDVEALFGRFVDLSVIEALLERFFGNYIYERFIRSFYGQLKQRHGADKTKSFLKSIRECIRALVERQRARSGLSSVQWNGAQGSALVRDIMDRVFAIFA